jgi:hypothetical protein
MMGAPIGMIGMSVPQYYFVDAYSYCSCSASLIRMVVVEMVGIL